MTTRFGSHVPDILDCLAQLSNSAVPTPPKLAKAMLDILPEEVWSRPDYVWLDPFSKSGVFLREVATRLFDGLADWEPDFVARREHIFRNMLFGAATTEMTGIVSRRSVYCSADASSAHSVVRFDDPQGNLPFLPAEHDFDSKGKCRLCGAPQELERGDSRENYAYAFTHSAYPTMEMANMKFDVIVGNPPYQVGVEGNSRTRPVYHQFVDQANAVNTRYEVSDNTVTQIIEHGEGSAYPIVADPWLGIKLWSRITVDSYRSQPRVNLDLSGWGWAVWSGVAQGGGVAGFAAGQAILNTAGWSEAQGWSTTVRNALDKTSQRQQFECHALGALFAGQWNLEKFRPNRTTHWSFGVAVHHCNWTTANRY